MLRVSERTDRIHHIPRMLYHWRAIPGSIAAGAEQKSGVPELQARAVTAHLERIGVDAVAVPHPSIPHRAQLATPPGRDPDPDLRRPRERRDRLARRRARPRAGGALAARGLRPAAGRGDRRRSGGRHGARGAGREHGAGRRGTLQPLPGRQPRRRGGAAASGSCSAPTRPRSPSPTGSSACCCTPPFPGVVAVGPLIARPDGRTEAAGVAVGLDHPALPMLAGLEADADGYYGSLACSRDVSALSADFLCVERAAFESAGGFEENYATGYEDFDLCQRLRGPRRAGRLRVAPAGRRPRDAGLAARVARHRRPGAVRRPLVRAPRARRPLLQPELHPRPRGVCDRLMPASDSAGVPEPMRLVIVYFGPFNVNSAIQAFHFGNDLTGRRLARDPRGRGRRPGDDPRGRRAQLRVRHPPRPADGARAVPPSRRADDRARLDPARERPRRDRGLRRPARGALRRPPRGQRVVPLRRRGRPADRRGSPPLARRAGSDQPADPDPPDPLRELHGAGPPGSP